MELTEQASEVLRHMNYKLDRQFQRSEELPLDRSVRHFGIDCLPESFDADVIAEKLVAEVNAGHYTTFHKLPLPSGKWMDAAIWDSTDGPCIRAIAAAKVAYLEKPDGRIVPYETMERILRFDIAVS